MPKWTVMALALWGCTSSHVPDEEPPVTPDAGEPDSQIAPPPSSGRVLLLEGSSEQALWVLDVRAHTAEHLVTLHGPTLSDIAMCNDSVVYATASESADTSVHGGHWLATIDLETGDITRTRELGELPDYAADVECHRDGTLAILFGGSPHVEWHTPTANLSSPPVWWSPSWSGDWNAAAFYGDRLYVLSGEYAQSQQLLSMDRGDLEPRTIGSTDQYFLSAAAMVDGVLLAVSWEDLWFYEVDLGTGQATRSFQIDGLFSIHGMAAMP